jgi:hypothetical protein
VRVPHIPVRVEKPLLVVLLLAVAVRVGLFVLLPDGVLHNNDSAAYLSNGFFQDPRQPSGYYFMLALLRNVDNSLWPIFTAQHLIGLGAAVLSYLAAREVGLRALPAALVALPLAIGSEMLYLEHTVLTDALFVAEVAGILYTALRSLRGGLWWCVATGVLLGLTAITRSAGVPLAIVVIGWLALAAPHIRWSGRLKIAAVAVLPFVAVVGAYQLAARSKPYDGLSDLGGRYAYARVAQFADCTEFTPPAGTRRLCDSRPSRERPGSRFWVWNPESPAFDAFPLDRDPRAGDAKMREFAARAIRAQPIDYITTVLTDLARYVRWDIDDRPDAGNGSWALDVSLRVPTVEATVARFAQRKYPGVGPPAYRGEKALGFYATAGAVAAPLLLLLVALCAFSAFRRSPWRRAAALCIALAFVLMVVPVATLIYNQRYAVPAYPALALGAVIGACTLLGRGLEPPAWVTRERAASATGPPQQ